MHFLYGKKIRERKEVKHLSQAQPDWQQGEIEVGSWCDRTDQQINCMVGNQVDTSTHLFLLRLWRPTVSQFQPYFLNLCDLIKSRSISRPQFPPLTLRIIKVLTSQSCLIEETTYVEMPASFLTCSSPFSLLHIYIYLILFLWR